MKIIGFLISFCFCIVSCKMVENHPTIVGSTSCQMKLDTLNLILDHTKFGVYSVNLDILPVLKYDKMSLLERANKRIPLTEKGLKIYELEKFINRFVKRGCLAEITMPKVVKAIGPPYEERTNNSITYRLLLSEKCLNCSHGNIYQIFENCSFFRLFHNDNSKLQMEFNYPIDFE